MADSGEEMTRREMFKRTGRFGLSGFLAYLGLRGQRPGEVSAMSNEGREGGEQKIWSKYESDHPGHFSDFAERNPADSRVNTVKEGFFRTFITEFQGRAAWEDKDLWKKNRMMGQLWLPLKREEIRNRELNFDIREPRVQTGMGFEKTDLDNLTTVTQDRWEVNPRLGSDGLQRSLVLVKAEDIPMALSAMADKMTLMKGEYGLSAEARFDAFVGDLGVTTQESADGRKWTDIRTNETVLGENKRDDGQKLEEARPVHWHMPEADEKQVFGNRHRENPVLLAMVWDPITDKQRIEAYSLSTTPDIADPNRDLLALKDLIRQGRVSIDGGRWLPVGEEETAGFTEKPAPPNGETTTPVPDNTPTPGGVTPAPDNTPTPNPTEPPKKPKTPKPILGNPGNDKNVGRAGELPPKGAGDPNKFVPTPGVRGASDGEKGGGNGKH